MGCEQSRVNSSSKQSLSSGRIERIITIEPQIGEKSNHQIQNGRKATPIMLGQQSVQGQEALRNMDPVEFEEALEEYKECEENIRLLEREDPLTLYYIKKDHLQNVNQASEMTQDKIKSLHKAMQNGEELKDGTQSKGQNLRKVVMEYGIKDIVSKAEQEFLTGVNRLEIAATELEMLQQEKALVESEVSAFKTICIKLIKLYNTQDEIAKKLTLGVTNPDEAKLYKELAKVETKKIKISEAFQRWREARAQIIDACREFSTALKKWKEIKNDSPSKLYDLTEEVRDDLVTSLQCISNSRFYIRSELPYCSKAEMAVLEKALSYIFIDMNTAERRLHADTCYKAFHNRAIALFAWTDMTIKEIIEPESRLVAQELLAVTKKVREVRFRTIQKQFPDVMWRVTDDDTPEDNDPGSSVLTDPESLLILDKLDINQVAQLPTIDEIYGKSTATNNYKSLFLDNLSPDDTQSLLWKKEPKPETIIVNHKSDANPNGVLKTIEDTAKL